MWKEQKWNLVGGALLLILGSATWFFTTCYQERKEALAGFRAVRASNRAAEEKYVQEMIALGELQLMFSTYLRQKDVAAGRVEQYIQDLRDSARQAGVDCNNAKQTSYEYTSHHRNLSRLFFVRPVDSTGQTHACAGFPLFEKFLSTLDPKKLAGDSDYRQAFLDDQAVRGLERILRDLKAEPQVQEAIAAAEERMISDLDQRASSIKSCVRDCIGIWVGPR